MTGTDVPTQHDADASDEAALLAIREHHTALGHDLAGRVDDVLNAVRRNDFTGSPGIAGETLTAQRALVTFLLDQLLPHAAAEEGTLYPAAAADPRTAALVRTMIDEHDTLTELATALETATDPIALAATAAAIRTLFDVHVHKENDYLLPALTGSGANIAALLANAHHLLTETHHGKGPGHRDDH